MSSVSGSRLVTVLRQRGDLRLLLAANVVSLCGDWVLGIGIAYAVYDLTGSTLASAGSLLAALARAGFGGKVSLPAGGA